MCGAAAPVLLDTDLDVVADVPDRAEGDDRATVRRLVAGCPAGAFEGTRICGPLDRRDVPDGLGDAGAHLRIERLSTPGRRLCFGAEWDNAAGRGACLAAIVRDNASTAHRLVVERDESTYDFDRRTLTAAVRQHECRDTLRWDLLARKEDPLLWVPDAVAWCWVRGGHWRRLIAELCELRDL